MPSVSPSLATQASNAALGSVNSVAAIAMLKKSNDLQSSAAAQLLAALPQPALATSGSLGTNVNVYA